MVKSINIVAQQITAKHKARIPSFVKFMNFSIFALHWCSFVEEVNCMHCVSYRFISMHISHTCIISTLWSPLPLAPFEDDKSFVVSYEVMFGMLTIMVNNKFINNAFCLCFFLISMWNGVAPLPKFINWRYFIKSSWNKSNFYEIPSQYGQEFQIEYSNLLIEYGTWTLF